MPKHVPGASCVRPIVFYREQLDNFMPVTPSSLCDLETLQLPLVSAARAFANVSDAFRCRSVSIKEMIVNGMRGLTLLHPSKICMSTLCGVNAALGMSEVRCDLFTHAAGCHRAFPLTTHTRLP